tara:strand:+ start:414 stop:608 length:195 start_codon:yes stop_codon:yes gene_type:complete
MKILYNIDACQNHNKCANIAPELFEINDEGYAAVLIEGEIPSQLEEKAQLAAQMCPEFAIEVST